MNTDTTFEIVKHIGVINEYQTGWKKELNVVAWCGGVPKYDIRDWDEDHNRMSRGITLHEDEAKALAKLLSAEFRGSAEESGFEAELKSLFDISSAELDEVVCRIGQSEFDHMALHSEDYDYGFAHGYLCASEHIYEMWIEHNEG